MLESPSTPLQKIQHPLLKKYRVQLYIKREDLIHPLISGNKWYKLKYNLIAAKIQGFSRVLSFGGAYSNHLHALAWAGKEYGFETVGVIRGELIDPLNPTLCDVTAWGMKLHPVSRTDYRRRHDEDFVTQLRAHYQPCYVVPEGGANALALKGCAEIVEGVDEQLDHYDYLCVPCGTGATLAGISQALKPGVRLLGFSALKKYTQFGVDIGRMYETADLPGRDNWQIIDGFHCGGFGKISIELIRFMTQWQDQTGIALDPIYTGKMMMGLFELLEGGFFKAGSSIVAVHTGGLQGLRGMKAKMDQLLPPAC